MLHCLQDLDQSLYEDDSETPTAKNQEWRTVVRIVAALMMSQESTLKSLCAYDIPALPSCQHAPVWGRVLAGLPSEQHASQVTKLNGALYMVIHMVRTKSYSPGASMLEVCLLHTKSFVEKRTEFSLKALEEQER